MAFITTKIQGLDKFEQKYEARTRRLGNVGKKELSEIGRMLKKDVVKSIRKITGSRQEVRYGPKRTVRVSNRNQAPNHDRGRLVRGIRSFVRRGTRRNTWNLNFQSRAPYALSLEYGTRKMEPRPYMAPALKRNRKKIVRMIAKGVKNAL